jgi:predicted nucleic acid-binding Zn ribbon protein
MELQHLPINLKKHSNSRTTLKSEISNLIKGVRNFQKARFPFWEEVMGEKISNVAVPVNNKKGVLLVKVRDPIWRFELTRRKAEIISKINKHLKKHSIKDIVFI